MSSVVVFKDLAHTTEQHKKLSKMFDDIMEKKLPLIVLSIKDGPDLAEYRVVGISQSVDPHALLGNRPTTFELRLELA